jgi:hypothetical protein
MLAEISDVGADDRPEVKQDGRRPADERRQEFGEGLGADDRFVAGRCRRTGRLTSRLEALPAPLQKI